MGIKEKIKFSQYENTVIDFVNSGGVFLTYTRDNNFIKLLHRMVLKHLGIKKSCIATCYSKKDLIARINLELKTQNRVLLFLERVYDGIQTTNLLSVIRETYKDKVFVIMLTTEVEKEVLIKFYELGANNFITKPFSMNTLIEKIAFTVKPQSKLGEIIEEAKAYLNKGNLDLALKKCDEILKIKPNSAAAYMIKGDIYKKMGNIEKAKQCYLKAHTDWKLYLDPLKRLVEISKDTGDKKALLEYLKKLDKLSPLNVERKVEIGTVSVEIGNKEEGEKYLDSAITLATKQLKEEIGNLAIKIADNLMNLDSSLAEKYYRKALDVKKTLDASDIETFNRLGICLRQQKKPKLAIEEYKKALKLDPYNERIMYNMSMAYLEAGEVEKARDILNVLLRRNPDFGRDNEVVLYNMGMIFYKGGDKDRAIEFFKKSLRTNPDYDLPKKVLKRILNTQ
ncbi:response regulator [Desulfothermus okinawensis JCM 13304]